MKLSRVRVVVIMALMAQVCTGIWWDEGGELDRLVVFGLQTNPRLQRFWHAAEQADSDRVFLGDFWDPRLSARAGHAVDVDGEDRAWVGVGAETPVPILGYLGFTLEQGQVWPAPDAGVDHLHQSIVRVDWRLPLHRDRGFREWRIEDRIAVAEYEAAYARWLSELQALRRDISLAYVAVLEKHAALKVTGDALERAERLQSEAEALSELQSIPAYQTAAARLEAVLRR